MSLDAESSRSCRAPGQNGVALHDSHSDLPTTP